MFMVRVLSFTDQVIFLTLETTSKLLSSNKLELYVLNDRCLLDIFFSPFSKAYSQYQRLSIKDKSISQLISISFFLEKK